MKIAVSSTGKDLGSEVSQVFGRCPYFIVAETDMKNKKILKFEAIENESAEQKGGAGISAAQKVAETGADAVITGNAGPRALEVLKQFGIGVYAAKGTVKEALQKFMDDRLEEVKK